MFRVRKTVRLRDTDATGVIYFTEQLRMALETFESFLKERGYSLSQLLSTKYLMPIVHAEADYSFPLKVDDEMEISLRVGEIGSSSFSLEYEFYHLSQKKRAGTAKIIHVFVRKDENCSTEIPEAFKNVLKTVSIGSCV